MSVKLKITLFITILIVLSLGITIYYLSYEKFKPEFRDEIQHRIYIQLNYIEKIIAKGLARGSGEPKIRDQLLYPIVGIFKTNPELLYVSILKKEGKHYRTFSVYRRNIISLTYKDKNEIYNSYKIERIKKFKGGKWPIRLNEQNKVYTTSLNVQAELKSEFITNKIRIKTYISNLQVLKKTNDFLKKTKRKIRRKRLSYKVKRNEISKINKKLWLVLNKLKKSKKHLKKFLLKFNTFLEYSDTIYVAIGKNHSPFKINDIKRMEKINKKIVERLDNKKFGSSLQKIDKDISSLLTDLQTLYSKINHLLNRKKMKNVESIKVIRMLFPIGKINETDLYKKINIIKAYRPIIVYGKKWGYFEIGVSEDAILKKIKPIIHSSIKSSLYIVLGGLLFGLLIALYIIFPIKALEKGADEITKDLSYRIKIKRKDEFGKFAKTFNGLANQLTEELTKYEKLYKDATEDSLTKLMVRKYFMGTLSSELINAKKENRPTSLFMTDIDHFKKFNDTYGHQTGDIVLSKVAEIVRKNLRKNRVRNDVAGRYGGEEFAVLLPDTNKEEALQVAERIRKEVEAMRFKSTKGEILQVTISIGVATSNDSNIKPEQLIERADKALYNSKETGRNKVSYG